MPKNSSFSKKSLQFFWLAFATIMSMAAIVIISMVSGTTGLVRSGSTNLIASTQSSGTSPKNIQECYTCELHASADKEEPPFIDVPLTHPYYRAIKALKDKGVVQGNPDGTFSPDTYLKRAEVMAMVTRALGVTPKPESANCFDDVKTQWFAPYICYGKMRGWISGVTPATFNPEGLVSRAEAWKIVLGAYAVKLDNEFKPELGDQVPRDVNPASWYAKYVYTIYNRGWADDSREGFRKQIKKLLNDYEDPENSKFGDNRYFMPGFWVSRGELAEIIYRVNLEAAPTI